MAHLKKTASIGHLLKNSAGHLVNECGGGVEPGSECVNCETGTAPANMTVTGGTCIYFDGGPAVCAQNSPLTCRWGNFPTSGSNARVQITFGGGHYFLTVDFGGLFDSCVYELDLGTTKPDCSAFDN